MPSRRRSYRKMWRTRSFSTSVKRFFERELLGMIRQGFVQAVIESLIVPFIACLDSSLAGSAVLSIPLAGIIILTFSLPREYYRCNRRYESKIGELERLFSSISLKGYIPRQAHNLFLMIFSLIIWEITHIESSLQLAILSLYIVIIDTILLPLAALIYLGYSIWGHE